LKEFLERMKWIMEDEDDYDFYFEGKGDGNVGVIIEEKKIRIVDGVDNERKIIF
jgi:hypothetical protein